MEVEHLKGGKSTSLQAFADKCIRCYKEDDVVVKRNTGALLF